MQVGLLSRFQGLVVWNILAAHSMKTKLLSTDVQWTSMELRRILAQGDAVADAAWAYLQKIEGGL